MEQVSPDIKNPTALMCAATCTACDVVRESTHPFDTNADHDQCPFGQVIIWRRANPTRFALDEAKYFLDCASKAFDIYKTESNENNKNILLYYLDAFFSSARNITFHMQKQYGNSKGFSEWYKRKKESMAGDNELRRSKEIRNFVIKERPLLLETNRGISYGASLSLRRDSIQRDSNKTLADSPIKELQQSPPPSPTTYDIYLLYLDGKNWKRIPNGLTFCKNIVKKLEDIVNECEATFGESISMGQPP